MLMMIVVVGLVFGLMLAVSIAGSVGLHTSCEIANKIYFSRKKKIGC